jgi:predicted HAD superfamily phosphohydrolase YqeG
MKFFVVLFLFSLGAIAQEPSTYLKIFDSKVYSLKTKGVKDFVVDLENTRLTKQINDQQSFGKIE